MKPMILLFVAVLASMMTSVSAQSWDEIAQKNIEAATNGDVSAAYEVGVAFLQGRGVEKNLSMASYWFKIAAQKGDARAKNALTKMAELGNVSTSQDSVNGGRFLAAGLQAKGGKVALSEGTFSTHIEKGVRIQGMPACNIRFTTVGGKYDPKHVNSYLLAGSLLFIKVTQGGNSGEMFAIKLSYKKDFEKTFHAPTYLEVESTMGKVAVATMQANVTAESLLMAGPYDEAMNEVFTGILLDRKFKVGFKTSDSDVIYSTTIDIDVVDTEKVGEVEKKIRNQSNLDAFVDCMEKR